MHSTDRGIMKPSTEDEAPLKNENDVTLNKTPLTQIKFGRNAVQGNRISQETVSESLNV
jgi:hypothetical protein